MQVSTLRIAACVIESFTFLMDALCHLFDLFDSVYVGSFQIRIKGLSFCHK